MFEVWFDGKAPPYSPMTTSLKPGTPDLLGISWSRYGGRTGIWRFMRIFEDVEIAATVCLNARCAELFPEVETTITDKTDSPPGQLLPVSNSRAAKQELLIDTAGQKDEVSFAFGICPQGCRGCEIATLNVAQHKSTYHTLGTPHDARPLDGQSMLMKQPGFPGHHHRSRALTDGGKAGIERYELRHDSPEGRNFLNGVAAIQSIS